MCGTILKQVVLVANGLLLVCGLAGVAVGGLLQFQPELILPHLNSTLSQLTSLVNISSIQTTIDQTSVYAAPLTYGLMGGGAFLVAIGGMGFASFYCLGSLLLAVYIIVLAVLATVQIAIGGVYLGYPEILETVTNHTFMELIPSYIGFNDTSPASVVLNTIQLYMECCGGVSGEDYKNATKFDRTYNGSAIDYPVSCCKVDNSTMTLYEGCPTSFTTVNSNYDVGCGKGMLQHLKENGGSDIAVGIILVACVEFALVVLTTLYLMLPV